MNQAFNPFLPSFEYIPDGEPYVFDGRVYIYGSHDKFNGEVYCENNYVSWSASEDDLTQWRYEGVIYDKVKDPLYNSGRIDKRLGYYLYAPDLQQGPDGRFYLYYAFDFLGIMSVAVCDRPSGTFEFYGYVHYKDGALLSEGEDDFFQFDPGVLVDDDQRVYLYSGFCPVDFPWDYFRNDQVKTGGGMVIELEKDMLTIKEAPKVIFPDKLHGKATSFEGHEFFEASSIRKIDDTYYFVYSSLNGHELCYARSKSPTEGFVYGGTIISNGDIYYHGRRDADALNYTGNNHGSIVKIKNQWYVFYHRQTNKHQFSRQACAEKININEDGSISQVELTSCGLNEGPLVANGTFEARIACNLISKHGAKHYEFGEVVESYHPYFTQEGEDREDNPNQYIANMTDGAIAGYKFFDIDDVHQLSIRIRGEANGKVLIYSNLDGEPIATISINNLKDREKWCDLMTGFTYQSSSSPIYFKYKGIGYIDFNSFTFINSLQ